MQTTYQTVTRLAVLMFVVLPLAAWAFVKPVRVLAPELVGISCKQGPVCVDDPSQLPFAQQLYAEGMAFVNLTVSALHGSPQVIFCSSQACAESFGLGARTAVTLGTWGTVIGPRGWKPYYVRHELIHHLQGQRLGVIQRLLKPSWFIEGMAYALSQDPRSTLPEPWESDRARFNAWHAGILQAQFWQKAGQL